MNKVYILDTFHVFRRDLVHHWIFCRLKHTLSWLLNDSTSWFSQNCIRTLMKKTLKVRSSSFCLLHIGAAAELKTVKTVMKMKLDNMSLGLNSWDMHYCIMLTVSLITTVCLVCRLTFNLHIISTLEHLTPLQIKWQFSCLGNLKPPILSF